LILRLDPVARWRGTMRRYGATVTLLCFVLLSGCINAEGNRVSETKGTIVFNDFEGGFYGIVADNGERYDPLNLPPDFNEDGLRVKFEGVIQPDVASFHMWGKVIELTKIERL
jgi:hypothetical protein